MSVGEQLRQLRQSAGLSMRELGAKIGVSVSIMTQWERRLAVPPSSERIRQLCAALECPEREEELLRIAHRERGIITISLAGVSDGTLDLLTSIEHAARHGRLTPRRIKALRQALR